MSPGQSGRLGSMPETMRITTVLEPRGPAAAIVLSDDQRQALAGDRKAVPVRVTVNGHTIGLRMTSMRGETMIGFSKAARAECELEPGDAIEAEIIVDDGPREIVVPDDLAAAFKAEPGTRATFDALAPSHRRELVRGVAEAKKQQTRDKRVADTVTAVREGRNRR